MHIFSVVLQSVLVLLGIGFIGLWITRRRILPESVISVLSTLVIDIALPATVFASVIINFDPQEFPDWWQLPLWWLAFTIVAFALTLLSRFVAGKEIRPEWSVTMFFQNGLFFPLIILTGLFGEQTPLIAMLFILMMFHPTLFFSTYQFFFKKETPVKLNWQRLLNPVLLVTVLAVVLRLTSINDHLPGFIVDIFHILGQMALPLIMLILGASLYLDFQQRGKFYVGEIVKFILVKNVVFPAVFIGLLVLLRPNDSIALLLFLQAVVPPVTAAPILVERGGGRKNVATQFVFASFIASMVTIPAMFLLFNHLFPNALHLVSGG
jgi:predicted permease